MGVGLSPSNTMAMMKQGVPTSACFTGSDMVAGVYVPALGTFRVFGELSTVTYSIHRELFPVRACGTINPKGYTRGGRTIAGTLIFTVFDRHVLYSLRQEVASQYLQMLNANGYNNMSMQSITDIDILSDELPPFDIVITMANEYNSVGSTLTIKGVRITNEGQTMSIEDMITENQMMYLAQDINLMIPKDVHYDNAYADYAVPAKPYITYWLSNDWVAPSCKEYKGVVRVNVDKDTSNGSLDPSDFIVKSLNTDWITVNGSPVAGAYADGKKYWDVSYTVAANNNDDARTGTIRIAKNDFTVKQGRFYNAADHPINPVNDPSSAYQDPIQDVNAGNALGQNNDITISPTNNLYFNNQKTASINITPLDLSRKIAWNATISDSWITMDPMSSFDGSVNVATVSVTNIDSDVAYRTGTITINGHVVYIQQAQPGSTATLGQQGTTTYPTGDINTSLTLKDNSLVFGTELANTVTVEGPKGSSYAVHVSSANSWIHVYPEQGTLSPQISVNPSGTCSDTLTVTVDAYRDGTSDRFGSFDVSGNTVQVQQKVFDGTTTKPTTQDTTTTHQDLPSSGTDGVTTSPANASKAITLLGVTPYYLYIKDPNNKGWSVTGLPTWLHISNGTQVVSQAQGTGDATVEMYGDQMSKDQTNRIGSIMVNGIRIVVSQVSGTFTPSK